MPIFVSSVVQAVAVEHYITTGGLVVVALISAFSAIQVAMIQSGRRWAKRAAERAEPTGNGYAQRTEAALKRIEADLGGLRADHRHLAHRFDRHIEKD